MSRILLLVELKGGNDGLNTLVPYADPKYRELRAGIGVPRERVVQLDEKVGLHEKLAPLMDSWKAGDLAILQGVGYPYPNRSHFRSIEIWDTASASSPDAERGLDGSAGPQRRQDQAEGVGVDCIVADTNALPSTGQSLRTIVMQDAENFLRQRQCDRCGARPWPTVGNPALHHLLAVRQGDQLPRPRGLRDRLHAAPAPAEAYGQEASARPTARPWQRVSCPRRCRW